MSERLSLVDLTPFAVERPSPPQGVRAVDIIAKKRDGVELTSEEVDWFVDGYTRGEIPDYQAAAWLMAVYLRGLNHRETTDLTLAMARSGEMLDLSEFGYPVDKHSTGGVGDKTSLVVLPMVAALGIPVGKMTGRGLGHTGGTLDKLEAIRDFRADLSKDEFMRQLREIGLVLTGQSADLTPADGKFYALRDVTGTIDSIPLIVASIMSKKIAGGAKGIVLDVKVGQGAFMKTLEKARALAQAMVSVGKELGRDVVALISDMNQPLGYAVGNALEVKEAIETMKGQGPEDFTQHCIETAAWMVLLAEKAKSIEEAQELVAATLEDGRALKKFQQLVEAQGGRGNVVADPEGVLKIAESAPLFATQSGYIQSINPLSIGEAVMRLGGGRQKKGDTIDHSVGAVVGVKVGDLVNEGDVLMRVHSNDERKRAEEIERLQKAVVIGTEQVEPLPLFHEVIRSRDNTWT